VSVTTGEILYGFCSGYFGRDGYGPHLCIGTIEHAGRTVAVFQEPEGNLVALTGDELATAIADALTEEESWGYGT
jgi:hypothetical protein